MAELFHMGQGAYYYVHLIEKGIASEVLSEDDAAILVEFIREQKVKKTQKRITPLRKTKLAQTLVSAKAFLKTEWTAATMKDLSDCADVIHSSKYAQNTINDHIVILKTFYRWLIRRGLTDKITVEQLTNPDDGIRAPGVNTETSEAKDLLSPDEITKIIGGCLTVRDKAIVITLYESAARVSELARAKWGDLEYTREGIVKLTIHDEKTRKKRYAPLLMAMEALAAWRSSYPGKPADEAFIFIDRDGKPMEYRAINYQIVRAARRAGIEKRITPHLFRKSRLTEMVREEYQESVIKELAWGNQNSAMMATYIKLGSDDVMNAFLVKSGIKKREEHEKNNTPRQCGFCFAMNSPLSEFCHKCGAPLTAEGRQQVEQERGAIRSAGADYVRVDDVQKMITEALQAAGLKK